ncbi:MAG: DUF881 domain-containing protein [Clostridia bacterium]|nr:DUF881 domain-containing protein [Clostridia bacterium]
MLKNKDAITFGIICLILTIGICVQIKTVNISGTTTSTNKQLNNLKTQVLRMKERCDEIYEKIDVSQNELEKTRKNVTSNDTELKALEEKINKYNILLGYTDVKGQGVRITLADAVTSNALKVLYDSTDLIIHDRDLLLVVNELKTSGAEAIEINGKRILGNTAISCDGNVVAINGEKVSSPFTINAIGFPERLAIINNTNGYLKELEKYGIKTTFKSENEIIISKHIRGNSFKYAKTIK